jgi:hypothetical protein
MSKAKKILEKIKKQVFMTENGLVSLEPIIDEAIAELEAYQKPQTSCHGCKYDDSDVDEAERKAHCLPCLEQVTLRRNYTESST